MADHALTTTVEISGVISPGMQKAMESAAASLQKLSNESLEAAGKAEQLTTRIRSQEGELKDLQKAYADYVLSGQEGSEEAQQLAQEIQGLSSELGENKGELEAAFAAADKLASGMDKTGNSYDQLQRTMSAQEKELQQLKNRYVALQLSEDDTTEESQQLAQQIDKLSAELTENRAKMNAAKSAADQLDHTLDDTGDAARQAEEGFSVFKGTLANLAADAIRSAWQGLKNLAGGIVETGMEFESSMSEVASISGATGSELQKLEDTAQEFGATTVFSASESAEALKYMSLAGWDVSQSTGALGGVLNLAAASGMELGAASDMVTDYLSAFGMEAQQSAYFADMLAYAQANSNTTAEQLGGAYKNCAANLNAAGQDIETVTSLLQSMADQGTKGEKAGTALSAMMRDITKKMKDGSITIGDTSIAVQDAQGNFRDLTDKIGRAHV